jgi:hypothetical protein
MPCGGSKPLFSSVLMRELNGIEISGVKHVRQWWRLGAYVENVARNTHTASIYMLHTPATFLCNMNSGHAVRISCEIACCWTYSYVDAFHFKRKRLKYSELSIIVM